MQRPGGASGNKGKVDAGDDLSGKLYFCFFCGLFEALHGDDIRGQVHACFALKVFEHPLYNTVVKVLTAQVGVAVGGAHFENALVQFENRNIESTTAEIEYRNTLVALVVQSIGQCSRGRLVDNSENFQTGNATCVLCCLALGVIEIGGHRDNGFVDGFSEIGLSGRFHFF